MLIRHHGPEPEAKPHSDSALHERFRIFAHTVSEKVGTPLAFVIASGTIVLWALSGPLFDFSDTWQLVINTSTTIVTFLMVFVIQNSQNRDSRAIQLKLDELIRAVHGARDTLVDLEDMTDEDLETFHKEFQEIRRARGLHKVEPSISRESSPRRKRSPQVLRNRPGRQTKRKAS